MGYYIDFVFDDNKSLSKKIIENKFIKTGAERVPFEEMAKPDKFIKLLHPYFFSPIEIFSNESKSQKGNWAHIRLSWSTDIDTFRVTLKNLMDLSNKVGSQLYDGQANIFITEDNVEDLISKFQKTSENIIGLVGQIKLENE